MASFVTGSIAPKQVSASVSRGVASASRAPPQPPAAEAVLADVQSVVESVLGAHVPADQPLMQVLTSTYPGCLCVSVMQV